MRVQCIDSMSSPSKRRLEPKKRPDTLIEALESLDLDGDDEEPMQLQEEIKRRDFAPKADPIEPRFENERFTVVIDDWSINAIPPDIFKKVLNRIRYRYEAKVNPDPVGWLEKFKSYPALFAEKITRVFPNAQILTMTQLEDILKYTNAVHKLDVRTVFVQFQWNDEQGDSWSLSNYRIKDLIFEFYATINAPLPQLHPRDENKDDAVYGHLFMVRFVCSAYDRAHWRNQTPDSHLYDAHDFIIDSGPPVHPPTVPIRSHILVSKRPFIVRDVFTDEDLTERDEEVNRDTVVALLRYFYDKRSFYPKPNNDINEPKWVSANNAARALQEIISVGLAKALPKALGVEPSERWDRINLDQDTEDATVDFVRRDPIYDPRLFMLIWDFVYSRKKE